MSAVTIYSQAAGTVISANGNSGVLSVGNYVELAIDINITVRTGTPSIQFFIDRLGSDGNYYNIWSSSVVSTTGQVSQSIGAGLTSASSFGGSIQFRWVLTGTTSFTLSSSLIGK